MLRKVKYDPKPLLADPLWAIAQGPAGIDGRDAVAVDGKDGRDGAPGESLNPRGEFRRGTVYQRLDTVRADDASYVCLEVTKSSPPSKAWQLLCRDGAESESPEVIVYPGQKGRPGRDGNSLTDIELLFEEDAYAGQVLRSTGDGVCAVTNALSFYFCTESFGLAVNNTAAGSRGLVRTMGLLTLPDWSHIAGCQSLRPGRSYALNGYGGLAMFPCNVAMMIPIGVAIKSDTLLISPEQGSRHINGVEDIKAPCLSTLPKGTPVYLATVDSVDAASHPDNWWVAGVLMADVIAGEEATYRRVATISRDDWSVLLESADALLVANQSYYLSDTPGKLTTDDTDRLFIGKAKSTKVLKVHVGDEGPYNTLTV